MDEVDPVLALVVGFVHGEGGDERGHAGFGFFKGGFAHEGLRFALLGADGAVRFFGRGGDQEEFEGYWLEIEERLPSTRVGVGRQQPTYPSVDLVLLMLLRLHQLGEQNRMVKEIHLYLPITLVERALVDHLPSLVAQPQVLFKAKIKQTRRINSIQANDKR